MVYLLSVISIITTALLIGATLSKIGKKKDELGKMILKNALSKSMLLTLGLIIISLIADLIGNLLNISFLTSYNQLWSILVVILIIIFINLKVESRKYFEDEK